MRNEKYKQKLLNRLKELDGRLLDIEHELDAPASKDSEERAVEREDDEVLEALGNKGLAEVKQIRAALVRMNEDTYGVCVNCNGEISDERLTVLPHTTLCRKCAPV